jgi:hypothetical protein
MRASVQNNLIKVFLFQWRCSKKSFTTFYTRWWVGECLSSWQLRGRSPLPSTLTPQSKTFAVKFTGSRRDYKIISDTRLKDKLRNKFSFLANTPCIVYALKENRKFSSWISHWAYLSNEIKPHWEWQVFLRFTRGHVVLLVCYLLLKCRNTS